MDRNRRYAAVSHVSLDGTEPKKLVFTFKKQRREDFPDLLRLLEEDGAGDADASLRENFRAAVRLRREGVRRRRPHARLRSSASATSPRLLRLPRVLARISSDGQGQDPLQDQVVAGSHACRRARPSRRDREGNARRRRGRQKRRPRDGRCRPRAGARDRRGGSGETATTAAART